MSEALTREQVEFHIGQIKCGSAESVADHADVIAAHDAIQRATIQQQAEEIAEHGAIKTELEIKQRRYIRELLSRIESLESKNRIAALALAEKEEQCRLLKGAMDSQDERERQAGAKCGVPHEEWGCDWPDAVAETVVALRAKLAEKEAEIAEFKRLISEAPRCRTSVPPELQRVWEACNTLIEKAEFKAMLKYIEKLEAEMARLKQDVNDLNQVLRNHGLAQGEIDAEASIDWKAEAKWAARRVGVAIITKDDHRRAQRILEEA